MALDRTVSVKLRADVAAYMAGLKQAEIGTHAWAAKVQNDAEKSRAGLAKVSTGLLGIGAVAGAGIAVAVRAFAEFDSSMSKVEAATHETADGMERLKNAALDAGARTAFSATEAAGAEEALAKAGVATADILGGALNGALDLAAAGTLGVSDAAEIAATAMTQFGLSGADVPHIADLLAAGAGKAQGEVSDLGVALKYVGPIAHQMGISIEETTGTIAELASNGILADQAGTSLRGMLSSLTAPSQIAADAMAEYNIEVYDAQGNFVGFNGVAEQMNTNLGALDNATRDAAFGQIFGNAQITAARILYEGGGDAVDKWTDSVNDAGFAQETAAIKMDNLKGDIERLKGSLETLFIQTGENADGFLRGATQQLEAFVNGLGDLPQPAQQAALGFTAIVGGASLLVGGGIKVVQSASAMKTALTNLSWSARGVGATLGIVGVALTVAVGFVAAYANAHQEAKERVEAMTAAIEADGHAIGETTEKMALDTLSKNGALEAADKLGVSTGVALSAALGHAAAMDLVMEATKGYTDEQRVAAGLMQPGAHAANDLEQAMLDLRGGVQKTSVTVADSVEADRLKKDALGEVKKEVVKTTAEIDAERAALIKAHPEMKTAAEVTKEFAERNNDAKQEITDQVSALDDLIEKLGLLNDTAIDATKSRIDFKQGIRDMTAAVKENGVSLDEDTDKGAKNKTGLLDLLEAAQKNAEAVADKAVADGHAATAARDAKDAYDDNMKALERGAIAAGYSRDEVRKLIREYGYVPPTVSTIFNTPGIDPAIVKTKEFKDYVAGLPEKRQVAIRAPGAAGAAATLKAVSDYAAQVKRQKRIDLRITLQENINRRINITTRNTRYKPDANGDGAQGVGDWGDAWVNMTGGNNNGLPHAAGGYISGPGGPTSDSIPAWLSNGEYVINAAATRANRSLLDAINNGRGLATGATVQRTPSGYASGGAVRPNGPTVNYGNVTVADPDEFFRRQNAKLADIAAMSNLIGG